jgi:predicted homoserine dehydrogenase-like protein
LNEELAAREAAGRPVKIGLIGAGQMGVDVVAQVRMMKGIGGVHPGVFLVVTTDHPRLCQALAYRDMGNGPYYTLFRPDHLRSIEVPLTCAMLVIRGKSNTAPWIGSSRRSSPWPSAPWRRAMSWTGSEARPSTV